MASPRAGSPGPRHLGAPSDAAQSSADRAHPLAAEPSNLPPSESGLLGQLRALLERGVWDSPQSQRPSVAFVQRTLQGGIAVSEGLIGDSVLLRASALTYYTMLSLVPLLAVVAAISGAIGVRGLIPLLVEPIGEVSPEMASYLVGFLRNFDFGSLGTPGAVMLFGTTLLGIGSIERALNAVWGVDRIRPWHRRIADYLAVLVVSPLLLGVAVSLRTMGAAPELQSLPWADTVFNFAIRAAPLILYGASFSFLFWFMPNTSVRPRAALLGGAVTTVMFVVATRLYVDLQVGVVRANALFGSLAAFPITVLWIYLSWVIVLIGAEIAYVHQNFSQMRSARMGTVPTPAAREAIGVAVAALVARAFIREGRALTGEEISRHLDVPERAVRSAIRDLEAAGVLALRGDPHGDAYQLGRAPDHTTVADVLTALRGARDPDGSLGDLRPAVLGLLSEHDAKGDAVLEGRTLSDLAR